MNILVPIDKSAGDRAVEEHVLKLARRLKASISVLHVVPTMRGFMPGSLREGQAYAELVASSLREQGINAKGFAEKGDPVTTILEYAEELDAEMVAMATRAKTGMERVLLGSVAEKVLKMSMRPVLLIRLPSPEEMQLAGGLQAEAEVA